MPFAGTWMQVENVVVSELRQKREKLYDIAYILYDCQRYQQPQICR